MDAHKNFAYSTVATAPSPASSGTSLVVASGEGSRFPAVPFNATVWPASAQPLPSNAEIVRVTNIATDTLTITRAQEDTSARTIVAGDQIAATITAKTLTDIETGAGLTVLYDEVLAADTATFDVQNIPAGYRHLYAYLSGRMTGAVEHEVVTMTVNNDGGNNYDWQYQGSASDSGSLLGGVSTTSSVRLGELTGASATTSFVGGIEFRLLDYASTSLYKAFLSNGGYISSASATNERFQNNMMGMWRSTAAINRITVTPGSGSFKAGTRLTIYGM